MVQLLPGEDPLAVGYRVGQLARMRAGRDEHEVGVEGVPAGDHAPRAVEPALAGHQPHALRLETAPDVAGLCLRQRPQPSVDDREVDADRALGLRAARALLEVAGEPDAELDRLVDQGHDLGGGDQRLARDDVGEHRGTARPVALDDGDLGAELRGHQRGFVAAGPPAEDDDVPCGTLEPGHALHSPRSGGSPDGAPGSSSVIVPPGSVRCGPWPCTRRTAATSTRSGWRCAHPTRPCTAPAGCSGGA